MRYNIPINEILEGEEMGEHTINQHYISDKLLLNFSYNGKLFESMINTGNPPYPTNTKSSMSSRYIYEHSFLEKNKLENYFSDKYESEFPHVINKIISLIENEEETRQIKELIDKYIETILVFYYRSGALLHEFEFQRTVQEDRVLLMMENIMNSRYINELGKTITENYSFSIIKNEDNNFLISDQYLSTAALGIKDRLDELSNRHIGLKDGLLLIPLSSKYYVVYYDGNKPYYIQRNKINELNDSQVKEINRVIINNSYVKCVSYNKEALIEALKVYIYKSPSVIYAGSYSGHVMGNNKKKEVFFYDKDEEAWEFYQLHKFNRYDELGRNDPCSCGSGMKFKQCHLEKYELAKKISIPFQFVDTRKYFVAPNVTIEKSIGAFNTSRPYVTGGI